MQVEYLSFRVGTLVIKVLGKKVDFFPHTTNRYSGGLFIRSSAEPVILGGEQSADYPLMVPEDTQIAISVESDSTEPKVTIRGAQDLDEFRQGSHSLITLVDFRRNIGTTVVSVHDNNSSVKFVVDVCPRKMSYDTDYFAIKEELDELSRDLALNFLSTGHYTGDFSGAQAANDLEWVNNLHRALEEFSFAFSAIAREPNYGAVLQQQQQQVLKLRRPTSGQLRALSKGKANGRHIQVDPDITLPVRAVLPIQMNNVDTPENRWIRGEITGVFNKLQSIIRESGLPRDSEQYRALCNCAKVLSAMLNSSFLKNVPSPKRRLSPSTSVLRNPRYRKVSDLLARLDLSFVVSTNVDLLASRSIDALYEIWCFVKVAHALRDIVGAPVTVNDLVSISVKGIRAGINRGQKKLEIGLTTDRRFRVQYNRTFKSLTGPQRPDIVIQIEIEQRSPIIIILDAKYRINDKTNLPPADAVNALHRYRDAIYLEGETGEQGPILSRPTVRGAALYPYVPQSSSRYKSSPLWESLDRLGIGAIPLLPGHDEYLRDWLEMVIGLPDNELARPGLPFEPYESFLLDAD